MELSKTLLAVDVSDVMETILIANDFEMFDASMFMTLVAAIDRRRSAGKPDGATPEEKGEDDAVSGEVGE